MYCDLKVLSLLTYPYCVDNVMLLVTDKFAKFKYATYGYFKITF